MIAIVVFLILILAAVAVTLTVVLLKKDVVEGDRFSFEDIFDSKMKVQRKGVRWVDPGNLILIILIIDDEINPKKTKKKHKDGSLTYKLNGDIYVQTLPNENAEVYIKGSDILDEQGNPLDFFDYWFSADQQYLLLGTQYEKVFIFLFYFFCDIYLFIYFAIHFLLRFGDILILESIISMKLKQKN